MKKESILILGGGADQKLLVEEFNNRGYKSIIIDYYDNPPAKALADMHYKVSTYDEEAIKLIAIKHDVKLITTISTDQPLLFAAKVSSDLGLKFHITKEQALSLTNKGFMKKLLESNKIPTAKHVVIEPDDITKNTYNYEHLCFPLITKPVDSSGSRGIYKINGRSELSECLPMAMENSRSKQIILEEFIEGQEISVDCMIVDSFCNLVMISDNHKVELLNNKPLFSRSIFPSSISDSAINKVKDVCQKLAKVFNLVNSPLFVQMIVKDNDVYVLELSARIAGGSKPHLIRLAINYNIVGAFVDLLLGKEVELFNNNIDVISTIGLKYIYAQPGHIAHISNGSQLKERGIIEDLILYRCTGDLSVGLKDGSSRIGTAFIKAANAAELNSKFHDFNNTFQIIDLNGSNIFINEN